jgi:hypothetical protein
MNSLIQLVGIDRGLLPHRSLPRGVAYSPTAEALTSTGADRRVIILALNGSTIFMVCWQPTASKGKGWQTHINKVLCEHMPPRNRAACIIQ